MFVCDFSAGLLELERLRRAGKLEKVVFSDVFSGIRYVKTTVCKYKNIWNEANSNIKNTYINRGRVDKAHFYLFLQDLCSGLSWAAATLSVDITSDKLLDGTNAEIPSIGDNVEVAAHVPHEDSTSRLLLPGCASDSSSDDGLCIVPPDPPHIWRAQSTLCPFCDQLLPSRHSQALDNILESIWAKTTPAPTQRNLNHRKAASIVVSAPFCIHHRNESIHIPEALSHNWPLDINFNGLFDHVLDWQDALMAILEDPEESTAFQAARDLCISCANNARLYEWQKHSYAGAGYYSDEGFQIILLAL
ncbi:unnamed protein product [Cyclocybe aegerita]|uniref:Uncharacterized protein n=1 Tax=Cyclocybe aegerita TaxID=1973307 RepID=A0A8S0WFN7_CYCAE|nr:unnamed protein product [Cyclocybe aegerita]